MIENHVTVTMSYITLYFSLMKVVITILAILLLSEMCNDAITSVIVPK